MLRLLFILLFAFLSKITIAQLLVARDTIPVIENGYLLKMPWANGINHANIGNIDLNFDGKKDLVVFDRVSQYSVGRFRCFINVGTVGQAKYVSDPELSYHFPFASGWAVCLDYNCDGKEDLFCSVNGGVSVYKNISTSTTGINFVLVKSILNSDYNPAGPPAIYPLYASSIGVPGLADIDFDGDIDILTFSAGGYYIEYHKNMSKELYGNCDSLIYKEADACWGKITEQSCGINLYQCPINKIGEQFFPPIEKNRHAGSCLMCIDANKDSLMDLVMGDIFCNTVQFASNTGSITNAVISDTTMQYPNYPNKNNTQRIKIDNFPCAYYADCDGDGKKDLVASPNTYSSENTKSMWYYKNTSLTNTVNFQFVKNNLLQEEMIEVGQNSYPVVFDYNNDGKKDLLIGNWGYYNNGALTSELTLYKNVGTTLAQPVYSLITRDFAGISTQGLINIAPTVGDIDTDGDIDICIGTSNGKIHWLENLGGVNNYLFHNNSFSITTQSAGAAPQLFDIDGDGKLDLMIGTKNGRVAYYKNIGSATVPSFSLITNYFGSIDVKGDINYYGIDGYAIPYFYKVGSATKLLLGNVNGQIYYYDVPVPSAILTTSCNLISATTNNLNEGGQATICFEDVNNDNKRDLFVGNGSGGLSFFSSASPFVGVEELTPLELHNQVNLFPNPATDHLQLTINGIDFEHGALVLYDLLGKEIQTEIISENSQAFLLNKINSGIYFAKINIYTKSQTVSVTKKIIIN
ncbi:MAG: T9SS type A sorting domain-containing protein [Bacteroidetes bacterium]|nr:T9SS type A sorting domain-containing protein [Bacteroidota bacterium]